MDGNGKPYETRMSMNPRNCLVANTTDQVARNRSDGAVMPSAVPGPGLLCFKSGIKSDAEGRVSIAGGQY